MFWDFDFLLIHFFDTTILFYLLMILVFFQIYHHGSIRFKVFIPFLFTYPFVFFSPKIEACLELTLIFLGGHVQCHQKFSFDLFVLKILMLVRYASFSDFWKLSLLHTQDAHFWSFLVFAVSTILKKVFIHLLPPSRKVLKELRDAGIGDTRFHYGRCKPLVLNVPIPLIPWT